MSASSASAAAVRWMLEDWVRHQVLAGRTTLRLAEAAAGVRAPVHLIFDGFLRMARAKKMLLIWEGRCPACGRSLPLTAEDCGECSTCGRLLEVIPVFLVSPDYAVHVAHVGASDRTGGGAG